MIFLSRKKYHNDSIENQNIYVYINSPFVIYSHLDHSCNKKKKKPKKNHMLMFTCKCLPKAQLLTSTTKCRRFSSHYMKCSLSIFIISSQSQFIILFNYIQCYICLISWNNYKEHKFSRDQIWNLIFAIFVRNQTAKALPTKTNVRGFQPQNSSLKGGFQPHNISNIRDKQICGKYARV